MRKAPCREVLLLSPPNPFLQNPCGVPRMGLLYLGTVLENLGHQVTVRHLCDLDELRTLVAGHYDFVGISATTREYLDAVQILNYFKREGSPAAIGIGGPHVTALPEEGLRNGFDLVVAGEADEVIGEIVENVRAGVQHTIDAGYVQNIDLLPIPDRGLLGTRTAWTPFLCRGQNDDLRTASILLSRGCPFRCTFCGPHFRYRRRSAGNIAAELRLLKSQGYDGLVILDDLPFLTSDHVRSFCDTVRPLKMRFRCNFRSDLMTEDMARLLVGAGCCRVQLGIESASRTVLGAVSKGTEPGTNGSAIEICKRTGLEVKAMFVFGLPGDGPDTARQLVDWVDRHRPDSMQISLYTPLPGSPLWLEYGHRVTDLRRLSFFHKDGGGAVIGVGNDRLKDHDLVGLYEQIIIQCGKIVHIDRGLPDSPAGRKGYRRAI